MAVLWFFKGFWWRFLFLLVGFHPQVIMVNYGVYSWNLIGRTKYQINLNHRKWLISTLCIAPCPPPPPPVEDSSEEKDKITHPLREKQVIKKVQLTSTPGLESDLSFRGDICTCGSSGTPRQLTRNNVFLSKPDHHGRCGYVAHPNPT